MTTEHRPTDIFPPTDDNGQALCQSCQKVPARECQTCPYKVEINDDCITMCNCCEACTRECTDDI